MFASAVRVCTLLCAIGLFVSGGASADDKVELKVGDKAPAFETRTDADARTIARAVADSPLVKTAIFGADPNWGRIVSAAGYAGVAFDEAQLDRYEALLDRPDPDIFDWLTGRCAPPPECDHDVTRLLLAFRYTPRPT